MSEKPSRPSERPATSSARRRPSLAPSAARTYREGQVVEIPAPTPFEILRAQIVSLLAHIGQIAQMAAGTLRAATKRPQEWRAIVEQIEKVGLDSVGIVVVSSLFVWPRLLASTVVMPLLCTIALVLGIGGAMFITALQFDISASFFFQSALKSVRMSDFLSGLMKAPVFGTIIALIACHLGLSTRGGTAGVGMSTTRTVVATSIAIFIADFLLTKVAILIWPD